MHLLVDYRLLATLKAEKLPASHQHKEAQRLYVCAFVHRRMYPQLVYVFMPCSFLKYKLFIHLLIIHL